MKTRDFKPGDKVMLFKDDMRKMKVVDYVVNTNKIDNWRYWEYPVWEDDVLVECTWPDKLGLPHYEVFNEGDLLLIEDHEMKSSLSGLDKPDSRRFNQVE